MEVAMDTPALNFVMLFVADLDESLRYFTETLGFQCVPEEDTPIFRYLKSGEGGIDFALRQTTPDTARPGAVELYFQSSDLEQVRADWVYKNVEATPIVERPFGAIFSIGSPDGHLLTVMSQR